jgi:hypothetical protein
MPAFCHGRCFVDLSHTSIAHQEDGDWNYYYMNRCVYNSFMESLLNVSYRFADRDLVARHIGMSVGSLELQTSIRETIHDDQAIVEELAFEEQQEVQISAQSVNTLPLEDEAAAVSDAETASGSSESTDEYDSNEENADEIW